jgi:hypothetical protein
LATTPRKRGDPVTYTPIKRVRIHINSNTAYLVRKAGGKPAKYILPEGNHHLAIYRRPHGKFFGVTVSYLEACSRWREQETLFKKSGVRKDLVVNRCQLGGADFITWLCENDMVRLTNLKTKQRDLYRVVSKAVDANGHPDIMFYHHTVAKVPDKKEASTDEVAGRVREQQLESELVLRVRNWTELMDDRKMEKVTVDPIGRVLPCHD